MNFSFVKIVDSGSFLLHIYVQPGATCTKIVGIHNQMLKIKTKAIPVNDKANKDILSFIAKIFNLKKNQICLISGDKSRQKVVKIDLAFARLEFQLQEVLNEAK